MIRGNAGIYHVKELLGHESLETLRHYAKLNIVDLQKVHAKCHPREKDG
jgi:integrase/recombinase XerD